MVSITYDLSSSKELITLVHPEEYFQKVESYYDDVDGVPN